MKHVLLNNFFVSLITLALVLASLGAWGQTTYYIRANGNWNSNTTWSLTSNGGAVGVGEFPVSGDNVIIERGRTVTVTADAACASITFGTVATGNLGTITVNNGVLLDVSGNITINNPANADVNATLAGLGTMNCNSIILGNGTGPTTNNTLRTHTITSTISNLTISNDLVINSYFANNNRRRNGVFTHTSGIVTINGSIITNNANAANISTFTLGNTSPYLNLGGETPFILSGTGTNTITLNGTGSTVEYNRSGNQDIRSATYVSLVLSGSGIKTLEDAITVRNISVTGISILSTQQFQITGNAAGTLTVGDGATLSLGSTSSGINTLFPTNFSTANITLDNNSTVIYQSQGAQTISAAPSSYGNLSVAGGNTKTIANSIRVNNTLLLNGANLELGSGERDLTISNGAAISGTFGAGNMIVCTGNGSVIKEGNSPAEFIGVYPLGTGVAYSPMEVISFSSIGSGSFSTRVIGAIAPGANVNDLGRHWTTSTTGLSGISANISFTYVSGDVNGEETDYEPKFYNGAEWVDAPGASPSGSNPFYTSGATNLDGIWTLKEPITTYYSYQSGNWNSPSTWTTDPSGSLSENPGVPGAVDRVVILNGRTIQTTEARSSFSVQINEGGTLDISSTTGHIFGNVTGQGLLRLSTNQFPTGDFSIFISTTGGTVEYYNNANFNLAQLEYNNLIFNLSAPATTVSVLGNLIVSGNLTIQQGTFRINNNAATTRLDLTVNGDVLVQSNGLITVGTGNIGTAFEDAHRFFIRGNFTNNGDVRFTNLAAPNYLTRPNHRVEVIFDNGISNQDVLLSGYTRFYRIEVNKGTDQTYILNIDATTPNLFYLFGVNNTMGVTPSPDAPNILNTNALGLMTGTLRLGANITIPSLAQENASANDLNYHVDEDACLWIDGANVTHTINSATSSSNSFVLYGKLKLTNPASVLDINNLHGIVMRANAAIEIQDGALTTPCIRTSTVAGTHRGSYFQSGGVVTITGNISGANRHPSLSFTYPTMSFNMSGGELIINQATNGGEGNGFSLGIGANKENVSVTGGTIRVQIRNRNANIATTTPFWNLIVEDFSGGAFSSTNQTFTSTAADASTILAQDIIVYNNFTIGANSRFIANNLDVSIGADFNVNAGSTYTPGTNTTIFNGNGAQTLTYSGTITTGLNNLSLSEKADLTLAGVQTTLAVRGNLVIGSGTTLRDNGRLITVAGNITNSGTHFRPAAGAGSIQLIGTAAQIIDGDGNGSFNNLTINKTGGSVTMNSPMTFSGELRLATNYRFNIGSNLLNLGPNATVYSSLAGTDQNFAQNRMILTNGLASDGGVKKTYSSTNEFIFPFGFYNAANSTYYYMPAYIQFSGVPTTYGSVTSRPVNDRHPLAQGTNNALRTYWKTTSSGFEGIPTSSVTLRYFYDFAASNYFVPVPADEANYIPAFYRVGTTWETLNDVNLVNQAINQITFNNQSSAQGEYTAGLSAAFTGIPILYSRQDGNWDVAETWSEVEVGGTPASSTPGPNTIVVIGNGSDINHNVTISAAGRSCGALFIAFGSSLDLGTTQGHNFAAIPEETVTGGGTLRIASNNYFPQGDFGEFIGPNGGTVEYYTAGLNITIPTTSSITGLVLNQYRNLILNHTGNLITLPNINLTIHDSLIVRGTTNQVVTSAANGWTEHTINKNFVVESGIFQFSEGTAANPQRRIKILGNLKIASGATFRVRTSAANTNHILELYGDIENSGVFNAHQTNSRIQVFFKGENNARIYGSGTTYNFFNITVDKGTSPLSILNLESSITTGVTNPFLTLLNGTFRVNNSSLTVTLTDGGTNFEIPPTAALSVNAGEVRVAYGAGTANLLLSGRLEVLGGSMYIGNPAAATNNSIEYASAGKPEILIEGGNLFVNGQIRRPTTTTSGSLNFIQSGGIVTIHGKTRIQNRAMLEIVNSGSLLSLSGGTISFDRPSALGTTFNDIYLRPDSSQIAGGVLQMGLPSSTSGFDFKLNTSSPLWDVSIGNVASNQFLTTEVLATTILNDLSINVGSEFRANGLDLFIGRNFINNNISASPGIDFGGFKPGSITQTTTFNGTGFQQISGSGSNLTNFANLTIDAGSTVALLTNSELRVNNRLNLKSGTFNDGENIISVIGNIINTANHSSPTNLGGIRLAGVQTQVLSGVGATYGNIIIDNSSGVSMVNNTTINGRLTFTNGSLYIDDYLLTFGEIASIGGLPDKSKMILLNGVLSDQGVRKQFPAGASAPFTIPIGVSGKFTPATYQINASSASGSIVVRPVNRRHPAVVRPGDDNALLYYWSVDSIGFGSPFSINHSYQYVPEDVRPIVNEDITYVVGHYRTRDYAWSDLGDSGTPGTVNEGARTISIDNANFIYGDVTAGGNLNFTPPLDIFYSLVANGNWTDPNSWSLESHIGTPATYAPFGNPVRIASGHTIHLNEDGQYSVSVQVDGTLDCGNTVFHNLGTVFGTGKINITSTPEGFFVFPGGYFDEFFATPGTTLEFMGTNTASLPLKPGNIYKPYQNVIFSGIGQKNMSAENMKVLGNLTISNGTVLSNTLHNKNLYLLGDWTNENVTENSFMPGTGTVFIEGLAQQKMNVTSLERFYNFTMNNTGGLELIGTSGIEITQKLTLTRGNIISDVGKEVTLINTTASIALSGGSAISFVDGPLRKRIISGQSFNFPVGNGTRLGRIELRNTSVTPSPNFWTVQYVSQNPNDDGYLTDPETNLTAPLTAVSDNEYWIVNRPNPGSSANIRLRWDSNSFFSYTSNATLRPLLRVVEYEGGAEQKWTQRGQSVSGTATSGIVATTTPVTQNDYIFTIGVIGVSAAIADLSPESICDNEETTSIPVNLTGTPPWSLSFRTTGGTTTNFTETNIISTPYYIQLRGDEIGGSVGSPYTLSLVSVSDQGSSGVVNPNTVSIEVKQTNKPSISGPTSVGVNETRLFSTPNNSGNSYLWSWDGSLGGTISTPSNFQTNITFNQGIGNFTLQVLETTTSTGCNASDQLSIEVLNIPVPDITPKTPANLCLGATETYSTNYTATNEYFWTVVGGTCSDCDAWTDNAQIDVEWNSVGSASITVVERIKLSPAVFGSTTQNFFVYDLPSQRTLTADPICEGEQGLVLVSNSQLGITYQLRLSSSDTNVGGAVPGNNGNINLSAGTPIATADYYVLAYNLGCELRMPALPLDITIEVIPTPTIFVNVASGDEVVCDGDFTEIELTYTVSSPTFNLYVFENGAEISVLTQDQVTTNPFIYTPYPVWLGPGVNNTYGYSFILETIDTKTCQSLQTVPFDITVFKIPQTGPQYHIPNN